MQASVINMKNLTIETATASDIINANGSDWSLKEYISKTNISQDESDAFDCAIVTNDGYLLIDGELCQVFNSTYNRYSVVEIDHFILDSTLERVEEVAVKTFGSNSLNNLLGAANMVTSYLLTNCLEVANGDFEECKSLFYKVEKAYKVSGFGECILIDFLQGKTDLKIMNHRLRLAGNAEIWEVRMKRKEAKKGSPFFSRRRVKQTRNIYGRLIN